VQPIAASNDRETPQKLSCRRPFVKLKVAMGNYIFSSRPPRSAFSLKELLVVVTVIGVLLALLLPAIQQAREQQRKEACGNNLKTIALGLSSYYYNGRALPPISSNIDPIPDIPGDASATTPNFQPGDRPSSGAGYSWIVHVLSEMEDGPLYQAISMNSNKFVLSAFHPRIKQAYSNSPHAATAQLAWARCPSFSGGATIETSPRTVGSRSGTIETGMAPPNYVGGIATADGAKGIAITNYNAINGTHIESLDRDGSPLLYSRVCDNGEMMLRGSRFGIARGLAAMAQDGTSKTILVAETRERRFASWYDGTMNWVVAARHSNPFAGTKAITPATKSITGKINGHDVTDRWVIGTDGTTATGGSSLNYGPTRQTPTAVYLPTDALSDPDISGIPPGRLWGPSSEHRGGIVNHAFADGHVESISDQIDPNVYLWMTTRNGGEPLAVPSENPLPLEEGRVRVPTR
jgi:prepilin-type processing-associated H-X9-DG protein